MTVQYLSPWKDDPYGKFRGDKCDAFFRVQFDNARIHKTEEGYIIAGRAVNISGVNNAFGSGTPDTPCFVAVPFYNKTYQIWEKGDDGKKKPKDYEPSIFEEGLCNYLDSKQELSDSSDKAISGFICHLPDMQLSVNPPEALPDTVKQNFQVVTVELDSSLPEYTPPSSSKGGGGFKKSYGLSPEQKLEFIKKELTSSIQLDISNQTPSLMGLVRQVVSENQDNELALQAYIRMIEGCL